MTRFALALTIALTTTPLLAQQFPNPQPNEHHKVLADEAGTWDAAIKMFFQGPDGPAAEFKGVETIEMVAGDRFSKSKFTCKFGDRDFEGHSLIGWDPQQEQYTGLWVDSFNAAPTTMTGTYDPENKTLTMNSTVVDGSGNELKQKQVTTYLDENKKRFESFLILEQGGRPLEVKLMEITSTRRQ